MTSGTWAAEAHLAQGEASGVDVHLGEAQMFERGGQGESCLHGDVTQQVGLLPALLQLVGGVVQHFLVAVAHLLHLQPVDLPAQADELAGQAVILDLHLPLWIQKQELKSGKLPQKKHVSAKFTELCVSSVQGMRAPGPLPPSLPHQLFPQMLQSVIDRVEAADVAHDHVSVLNSPRCGYGGELSPGVRPVCGKSLGPRSPLEPLLPLQVGWSARLQLQLLRERFQAVQILRVSFRGLASKLLEIHLRAGGCFCEESDVRIGRLEHWSATGPFSSFICGRR